MFQSTKLDEEWGFFVDLELKPEYDIYIKNIPIEYTEAEILEMFKPFGNIISCKLVKNNIG